MLWEKGFQVWSKNSCDRLWHGLSMRGRPIYLAVIFQEGIPLGDSPTAKLSAHVFAYTNFVRHSYSLQKQNRHKILSQHPISKVRSRMRWSNKCPTESDFQLWRDVVKSLCPSRQTQTCLGPFMAPTHTIWQWTWDDAYS